MLHKSFQILDAKADAVEGTFEATVAVFGNVDKGGDRIVPGAFDKTLADWRAKGDPIPIILSHNWDDPWAHIGTADPNEVTPTTKGLHVKGRLDITDNPVAAQVHRLMARRSLKEFSFGYSVPKGGQKRAKDGANDLLEIDLAEVGPTLKGMNPDTELHAVKSAIHEQKLETELQAVKAELAELKAQLTKTPETETEETDKGRDSGRSVDPLRRASDQLAIQVASNTVPAEPPKKSRALRQDDPLRQQSRDLMLSLLTSGDPK